MVTMLTPSFSNAQLRHGEFHNFDAKRMEKVSFNYFKALGFKHLDSNASFEAEKNEIHFTTNSSTLALQEYSILLPRPSMAQQDLGSPFAASLTKVSGVSFSRHLYHCIGCELAYAWFAIPSHVLPHSPVAKDFQEGSCWLAALTRLITGHDLCFCGALGDEAPYCPVRRQQFGRSTQSSATMQESPKPKCNSQEQTTSRTTASSPFCAVTQATTKDLSPSPKQVWCSFARIVS